MNRRTWSAIIIILVIIIIGIIYVLFFQFPKKPQEITPGTGQPSTEFPGRVEPVDQPAKTTPVSPIKKLEVKQDDLARMASAFAERFGSFSNQADYGNIRDLQIFMTEKMKSWSQNYIIDSRASQGDTAVYYGIVTKAVLSQVQRFDSSSGQAEILVKTQRRETGGTSGANSVFYQDITIKYLRQGSVWLVDEAYWQER